MADLKSEIVKIVTRSVSEGWKTPLPARPRLRFALMMGRECHFFQQAARTRGWRTTRAMATLREDVRGVPGR